MPGSTKECFKTGIIPSLTKQETFSDPDPGLYENITLIENVFCILVFKLN